MGLFSRFYSRPPVLIQRSLHMSGLGADVLAVSLNRRYVRLQGRR